MRLISGQEDVEEKHLNHSGLVFKNVQWDSPALPFTVMTTEKPMFIYFFNISFMCIIL